MFTGKYQVACVQARKPYWIHHKNSDFGAISVTERSCIAPISEVKSHISDDVHSIQDSLSCRHKELSGGPSSLFVCAIPKKERLIAGYPV